MAFARSLILVAFVAVGAQAFEFNLPFGNSFSSIAADGLGARTKMEDGAIVNQLELGPLGGFQMRLVKPVIPALGDLLQIPAGIAGRIGNAGAWVHNNLGLGRFGFELPKFDMIPKLLENFNLGITGLISNAGGILQRAFKAGFLRLGEIREAVHAVIKSSLQKVLNPLSKIIDLVEKGVQAKILFDKEAIKLVSRAVKEGLHKAESLNDFGVKTFLDGAAKAGDISKSAAENLKSLIGAGGEGNKDGAPADKPADAPADKPADAPAANPDEAPAANPDEAPAANPDEAPAANPDEAPAANPDEAPAANPDEAPAANPDEAPPAEPAA